MIRNIVLPSIILICFPLTSLAQENVVDSNLNYVIEKQKQMLKKQQEAIEFLMNKVQELDLKLENQPSTVQTQSAERMKSINNILDEYEQHRRNLRDSYDQLPKARVNLDEDELTSLPHYMIDDASSEKHSNIEWGGYIDVGYVDISGSGAVSSDSIKINSRADNLEDIGLNGNSSFLVNEINFNVKAHIAGPTEAIISIDILPRDFTVDGSNGQSSTDGVEVDLAYVNYKPQLESSRLVDSTFNDLEISLGKFDSPLGIEYRINKSPQRVNISRSHQAQYTTGYPLGIKAKAKIAKNYLGQFRNSVLFYNLALTNSAPFLDKDYFGDVDNNNNSEIMGRFAYGLNMFEGYFETAFSFANGAGVLQKDSDAGLEFYLIDAQYNKGPLTLRVEHQAISKEAVSVTDMRKTFEAIYVEGFYEFDRPLWSPQWLPLVSFTPYYRYDTRDVTKIPFTEVESKIDVQRHTVAFKYVPLEGNIFKAEYQWNFEDGVEVDDNLLLMSFIKEF